MNALLGKGAAAPTKLEYGDNIEVLGIQFTLALDGFKCKPGGLKVCMCFTGRKDAFCVGIRCVILAGAKMVTADQSSPK